MSYVPTIPATRELPGEAESDNLITCKACGAEYDRDDDCSDGREPLSGYVLGDDGEIYCAEVCIAEKRQDWHREAVAYELMPKLAEVLSLACELETRYHEPCEGRDDGPIAMIEDLKVRLECFAEGEPTGWIPNAVMLPLKQAIDMDVDIGCAARVLATDLRNRLHGARGRLARNHVINPVVAGMEARHIASLGFAVLGLREARERSGL